MKHLRLVRLLLLAAVLALLGHQQQHRQLAAGLSSGQVLNAKKLTQSSWPTDDSTEPPAPPPPPLLGGGDGRLQHYAAEWAARNETSQKKDDSSFRLPGSQSNARAEKSSRTIVIQPLNEKQQQQQQEEATNWRALIRDSSPANECGESRELQPPAASTGRANNSATSLVVVPGASLARLKRGPAAPIAGRQPEAAPPPPPPAANQTIQALVGQRLTVPCSNLSLLAVDQLSAPQGNRRAPAGFQRGRQAKQQQQQQQPANGQGISLIVWHKDEQLNSPIFTIDARRASTLREAKQAPGADWLRGRAHFEESIRVDQRGHGQTPALVIDEARPSDAGLYTCTVEFHKAPTQTHQIRVALIDPPRDMIIRDEITSGPQAGSQSMEGLIGPYDEDSQLNLVCQLEPGTPMSQVSWWRLSSISSAAAAAAHPLPPKQTAPVDTLGADLMNSADYLTTMGGEQVGSLGGHLDGAAAGSISSSSSGEELRQDGANYFVSMQHSKAFSEGQSTSQAHQMSLPFSADKYKLKHWTRIKDVSLNIGDKLQATIQLGPLNRAQYGSEFMCLANNNHFALPLNSSVIIDMNLKPNEVRIVNKASHVFKLGEKIMIECQVQGSKPRATIRWFKDKQELLEQRTPHRQHPSIMTTTGTSMELDNSDNNSYAAEGYMISDISTSNNFTQMSYLTLIPQLSDNQKSLSCVANNPKLSNVNEPLSDTIVMNVQYPPQLRLQLGSGIKPETIRVGSDVFMECGIQSNPPIDDLSWLFNDEPIQANVSAGTIISNQSLVLQRIRVEHRGKYQCVAQNAIGRSISNKLELRPKFEPICDYSLTKTRYEVAVNQQIRVACNVLAEPMDDIHFVWKFNQTSGGATTTYSNQGKFNPGQPAAASSADDDANQAMAASSFGLEELKQYETNFTSSHAIFSPKTRRQYGQLLCYASNSMGRQARPCTISIVAPELPGPVYSCFFDGITNTSFSVYCQAPVEHSPAGGRPSYLLELHTIANKSSTRATQAAAAAAAAANNPPTTITHLKQQRQEDQEEAAAEAAGDNNNEGAQDDEGGPGLDGGAADEQSEHSATAAAAAAAARSEQAKDQLNVRRARSESPSFHVTDLSPGTQYTATIYVQNSKGRSRPVSYPVSTNAGDNSGGAGAQAGRVQFINKRLSANGEAVGSSAAGTSLADRLISYLRVDDYLSRSVNNYYNSGGGGDSTNNNNNNNNNNIGGSSSSSNSQARPLIALGLIVLLSSFTVIVVAFFLTRVCRSRRTHRGNGRKVAALADNNGPSSKENSSSSSSSSSKKRRSRIWASNGGGGGGGGGNNSLGTKLSTYGGRAEPQLAQLQLTPARSSSCSSSAGPLARFKPTAAAATTGSGSDSSRETNTDSTTLISSSKSSATANNAINCHMIESPPTQDKAAAAAGAATMVSSMSAKMLAVRSSRESLNVAGKSPIMMMMVAPPPHHLSSQDQQQQHYRTGSLYSSLNRQHQQQQHNHNCSPQLNTAHSETPQMSIQSDCSSSLAANGACAAEFVMQVNAAAAAAADNHRPMSEQQQQPKCLDNGGGGGGRNAEPVYMIRSSDAAGAGGCVFPASAIRMAANQNCLNSRQPMEQQQEQQQQSIRLVGAATGLQGGNCFAAGAWPYASGNAPLLDNRSGNGAGLGQAGTQQVTTTSFGGGGDRSPLTSSAKKSGCGRGGDDDDDDDGSGNVNTFHLSSHDAAALASQMLEPPVPVNFLPSSSSIPVSLSDCQHHHRMQAVFDGGPAAARLARRYSQEFHHTLNDHPATVGFNTTGGGGGGSYLTLAPSNSPLNFHPNYQPDYRCYAAAAAAATAADIDEQHAMQQQQQQQQGNLINDLSQPFSTYVEAGPAHHLCGRTSVGPAADHHCSAGGRTLDNSSYRQSWLVEEMLSQPASGLARRGSFDRPPRHSQQQQQQQQPPPPRQQRVKFDDLHLQDNNSSSSRLHEGHI